MANARGKVIDNTHLSIDQAEARGFLHRDYIAHCLRWTHVVKHLGKSGAFKSARILDVGCGRDLPLAKLLYSSRFIVDSYVGIDYNHSKKFDLSAFHTGKFPIETFGSVDFASDQVSIRKPTMSPGDVKDPFIIRYDGDDGIGEWELPNSIVCFEVLEHVEPEHSRRMVAKMWEILRTTKSMRPSEDCWAFISTPCYDPQVGAAANHVNEIKYQVLGRLLEEEGFEIVNHFGTFASQRDYKPHLKERGLEKVFDDLSEYYDSNYLATIFAPLFPHLSRNCLWVLRPRTQRDMDHSPPQGWDYLFPPITDVDEPWTSSEKWAEIHAVMETSA